MLSAPEVAASVGHAVGGVCPFGVKERVSVYLDESLRRFETVYPAAGNSMSAVELSPPELEATSVALGWVNVCKLPE
jgi:prolyl-tRNA editing enzyme YbaK/EbsC (Cys-tRNA(Pro) deacylase)